MSEVTEVGEHIAEDTGGAAPLPSELDRKINQHFPGGLPAMRFRRTLADGDLAVLELELTYADGSRYLGMSVLELRDGKVVKETDYFAQPFQAPQWRAQWVERK